MRPKSSSNVGALHPLLFFATMYIVALVFSIFICSTLFHAFEGDSSKTETNSSISIKAEPDNATIASR